MKKLIILALIGTVIAFATLAGAADPVATAPAVAAAAAPAPAFMDWFSKNLVNIFGIALAVSELLGASPWFKGNGILDSIIKSLRYLASKSSDSQGAA